LKLKDDPMPFAPAKPRPAVSGLDRVHHKIIVVAGSSGSETAFLCRRGPLDHPRAQFGLLGGTAHLQRSALRGRLVGHPQDRGGIVTDITVTSIMGGPDVELVPHWLAHYRSLGLEWFVVAVNDPLRAEDYDRVLGAGGVTPAYHLDDLFFKDEVTARARLNEMVTSSWVLHADLDELMVFDRPLDVLLADCGAGDYCVVPGRFIDHLRADGQLAAVQAEPSLWQQYPLMHPMTQYVRRGCAVKAVLRRRDFPITVGNHLWDGPDMPGRYPAWQEIHHFRWTAATVPSLKHRIEIWPDYPFCSEWQNVLDFLGDPPRLDLERLRELAPFLDPDETLVRGS
jgi:hypothetical protein